MEYRVPSATLQDVKCVLRVAFQHAVRKIRLICTRVLGFTSSWRMAPTLSESTRSSGPGSAESALCSTAAACANARPAPSAPSTASAGAGACKPGRRQATKPSQWLLRRLLNSSEASGGQHQARQCFGKRWPQCNAVQPTRAVSIDGNDSVMSKVAELPELPPAGWLRPC